jgi:iron complex outermembrane receptor protein
MKNDLTPDFGIGSLDGKIPTTISRSSFFNTPWAYQKVDQTTVTAQVNHKINEAWKVNAIGSYSQFNRDYFSTERIQANAAGDWGRNLTKALTSEDYYTGQINLNGTVNTGKIKHNILIGADAERYNNISHTFKAMPTYDTINVLDPNKFVPRTDMPVAPAISRTETPTYRYGLYTQDLISVTEKIKVLAGLRWSFQQIAKAKVYDLVNNTETKSSTANTKIDRAISPRVGVVYQPISNTSVFVSYSNNFIPNTGKDVNEQNLKPSIVDQFEIGVKNDLIKGKLSANVTYYKIINSDLAIQAQFEKDGVTVNTNNQVKEFSGETTSDGLEIDIVGNIIPGLNFLAGYSYNFMRYTKTNGAKGSYHEGERLVGNPAHTGNATLFYTFSKTKLKGLKVGASGFYTGERNAGWNNTVGQTQQFSRLIPVSSFVTFDLSVGYSIKKISLLAKVSNITNELNYYVHENYSVNPIPPRQFLTTLTYRF